MLKAQKIEAVRASTTNPGDNTLPDPTRTAKWVAAGVLMLAIVVGIVLNKADAAKTTSNFLPTETKTADFALFATFYVVAQVIATLLIFISPFVPSWASGGDPADATARAAQVKADRSILKHALGALAGILASCLFGLYFLQALGIQASNTVDALATGFLLAGGAKPLQDITGLLTNKTAPETGTGADA
jgi:hypothetical protein